jgi:Asp-tRNA(Asn)/Glu-tRNA(Gln) amidotransferase A subunit family amidase
MSSPSFKVMTAAEIARQVNGKSISPTEVLEGAIARIEAATRSSTPSSTPLLSTSVESVSHVSMVATATPALVLGAVVSRFARFH